MHSKYNNIHKNEMVYVLIYNNNHVIISVNFMLSMTSHFIKPTEFGSSIRGVITIKI